MTRFADQNEPYRVLTEKTASSHLGNMDLWSILTWIKATAQIIDDQRAQIALLTERIASLESKK